MTLSSKQALMTLTVLFLGVVLVACGQAAPASEGERAPVSASLSELQGLVEVKQPGEDAFTQVVASLVLQVQSQIQTGSDGKVRLDVSDGSILRLGPQTLFTLEGEEPAEGGFLTKVKMQAGQLYVILSGGALEVDTPSGVASVRGSYMEVRIDPVTGTITITCLEGDCSAQTNGGEVNFSAGQTATITSEDLPPELGDMSPEDVLNWLQNNPEATVVIVPLTATVEARATDTPDAPTNTEAPSPTGTLASSATPTPVPPSNTPESPMATLNSDALCMTGPGRDGYQVVGTVFAGQTVNVAGQNSSHWVIEFPGRPGVVCWIPKGSASANDAAQNVRTIFAPPTTTPTPKPTKEKPTETSTKVPSATATECPEYYYEGGQSFDFSSQTYNVYYEYPCYPYGEQYIVSTATRAMLDLMGLTAKK